ncbi:unnamed protein product [Ceratitis capitata]|uniref:(Mediterranean fruit fly) hypothetical protein n=1 Tax=Ceratitis capitata TaxID=7213 RepID=A0A811V7L7_CERCA|nr:unnamed protein product [Ceratitis capitata]
MLSCVTRAFGPQFTTRRKKMNVDLSAKVCQANRLQRQSNKVYRTSRNADFTAEFCGHDEAY